MANNDFSLYKDIYITTSLENIEAFENAIVKLFNNLQDHAALEQAHRSIHTLKSKSMMMGFENTGEISKIIEDRLYNAKNGTKLLTNQDVKVLDIIGRKIQQSINAIKTDDNELDFSEEMKILENN